MTVSGRRGEKRNRLKKGIAAAGAVGLVILIALFQLLFPIKRLLPAYGIPLRGEGEMRVHFLDVGQGDCTVIEFPDGDALIVDAGGGAFETENRLIRYLKGLRITSVSMAATHADSDHFGGFTGLIEYFGADTVYLPAVESRSSDYQAFLSAAQNCGCNLETLTRYSVISRPSGAYCVCILPYASGETDENESSTVLFVSYDGVNLLLGADIGEERERTLAGEYALMAGIFDSGGYSVRLEETDILKVSHHGSAYSSSADWLSLLSPSVAVVSCGRGNIYSHPAAESIARLAQAGAEIYRTDELGSVVVSIKNHQYTVLTDLE